MQPVQDNHNDTKVTDAAVDHTCKGRMGVNVGRQPHSCRVLIHSALIYLQVISAERAVSVLKVY